ncbi:DUF6455 family protein [Paenirhodobacter sp.]|uniref:DUF6455 family protein n=1 Tax=Paenirhodobacter sp. TaxID=1965326 RepID=UPI003B41912C
MGMAGDSDLNFWIVRGLARRMGISVSDAMFDGRLSRAAFFQMVERCRSCQRGEACLAAMAQPVGTVPDCANARELARLHC